MENMELNLIFDDILKIIGQLLDARNNETSVDVTDEINQLIEKLKQINN